MTKRWSFDRHPGTRRGKWSKPQTFKTEEEALAHYQREARLLGPEGYIRLRNGTGCTVAMEGKPAREPGKAS